MKEQKISVQDYGKKLNPLAMFYMMIAIIIPSLGVTMIVVLATFLGLNWFSYIVSYCWFAWFCSVYVP
jgi:hypothetical protein